MASNNNWWTWIIIFFVGFSVLNGVASAGAFSLGLPLGISYIATLGLMGMAAFVYLRGYPVTAYFLGGAIIVIVVALYILGRGFLTDAPPPPEGLDADLLATYWEEDQYFDGYGYFDFDDAVEVDENPAIVNVLYYELSGGAITILFPEIAALRGQWAFTEASARLTGQRSLNPRLNNGDNLFVDPENTGFSTESGVTAVIAPALRVPLPSFQVAARTQSYFVDTSVTVIYPDGFGDLQTQTFERNIELIVPSDEIWNYQIEYYDYSNAQRLVEGFPGWMGWVGAIALSIVVIGVSIRSGALISSGSRSLGGVNVIVRKLGGLQKLGLEAHRLDSISAENRQGVENGVFIGVVNAQSPAGRADIRSGDILLNFDGKTITTPQQLERAAVKFERGQYTTAEILRHGQRTTVEIKF